MGGGGGGVEEISGNDQFLSNPFFNNLYLMVQISDTNVAG